MRQAFIATVTELLDEDPRTALVLAEISAEPFAKAFADHPDRAINVGIREQLMVGVSGGLALTGLRPIAHSYATFLVDRAYEQIKLDLHHQGVGAILVSVGASYDGSTAGYTHMSPMDVALIDTLPDWQVHVPGHADEVKLLLRQAAKHDGNVYIRLSTKENSRAYDDGAVIKDGGTTVVAVGPMLDPVLEATRGLDFKVVYVNTPRPMQIPDGAILVEPYLEGTSARLGRYTSIGAKRVDLHRYGTPKDHARWHGLDAASLRERLISIAASTSPGR